MLGNRELTIDDYLAILRRRRWIILILALLGPVLGYGASLLFNAQYTSKTLVLVEQQKVPADFVKSVVTDELNARLATMQEQILSRTRLQPIIEKFGLYKEDAGKVPMEDLVDRLRRTITVTAVRTMVGAGSQNQGLPGFTITFTADNPRLAQQVCAEITSMFMEENLRVREQRAEGTTEFLTKQLEEAKRNLDEQDAKLAAFKGRYVGQLPGQEQTNLNVLTGLSTQLDAVTQSLNRAEQDKTYLQSLLAQQLTAWQASQTGDNPQNLEQQLANLQSQLISLQARYTESHPDVTKLKNDIASLQKKINDASTVDREKSAQGSQRASLSEPAEILKLRNQLYLTDQLIKEKTREQTRIQEQLKVYQARVQLSPVVEQEYSKLTRDYGTALKFYDDLLTKKTQSEMATDLERRQQGEQFRVMDPANLPARPSFPNRPLFAGGGLAAGLVLGLGIAGMLEMADKALRNERDVEFYLQLPTLALVPSVGVTNGKEIAFWKRGRHAQAGVTELPRV